MTDKDKKMLLYAVGGTAAAYFLYKMISKEDGGDKDTSKQALLPEDKPVGVSNMAELFKAAIDKPQTVAQLTDNRESGPTVTSFGRQLISPAPQTSAPRMDKARGLFVQRHLNWFFGVLKGIGADTTGMPKLAENGEVDANTLKAFWVWFNTIWCARHIAGDEVLLGIAKPPLALAGNMKKYSLNAVMSPFVGALLAGYDFLSRKPTVYTYVPTADKIGRGTPADYAIYNLYSRNDPNLTGAFSDKAIDNVMYPFAGKKLSPPDLILLKMGYDAYLANPTYNPKGKWWEIDALKDFYPNPYPFPQ